MITYCIVSWAFHIYQVKQLWNSRTVDIYCVCSSRLARKNLHFNFFPVSMALTKDAKCDIIKQAVLHQPSLSHFLASWLVCARVLYLVRWRCWCSCHGNILHVLISLLDGCYPRVHKEKRCWLYEVDEVQDVSSLDLKLSWHVETRGAVQLSGGWKWALATPQVSGVFAQSLPIFLFHLSNSAAPCVIPCLSATRAELFQERGLFVFRCATNNAFFVAKNQDLYVILCNANDLDKCFGGLCSYNGGSMLA